jgi:hypothetical protein
MLYETERDRADEERYDGPDAREDEFVARWSAPDELEESGRV